MESLESYFKVSLQEELKRFPKLKLQDIVAVKEWLSTQTDLLCNFTDVQIAYFLHAQYYDLELTKRTIRSYLEYQKILTAIFDSWDPLEKKIIDQPRHVFNIGIIRTTSPSAATIVLSCFKANSAAYYDFVSYIKWVLITYQTMLLHDGQPEEVKLVFDTAGFSLAHVMKTSYTIWKTYIEFCNNAANIRITELHYLNTNFIVRRVLGVFKVLSSNKNSYMISLHSSSEEFFNSLPKDIVPEEYGGTGPSLETLSEENTKRILEMRNALIELSKIRAKDSKNVK